jgi:hypothetical protein
VIFFHSISVVLQCVSLSKTVQFIEACLASLERSEAGGRFYFTPAVHGEETLDTIEPLFSA